MLLNLKGAIGNSSPYAVIADLVVDDMKIDAITASMDMQMLVGTKGRERTLDEWNNLFNDAGFRIEKVMDIKMFAKYIVIRKQ